MWDKGKFASKKVIHMVLIAFCREVRVQCKEKLFQTPACKPGFHVKISNKKRAATDVAEAISLLRTFFSICPLPINCHLLLSNQHCVLSEQPKESPHKISSHKESAVHTAIPSAFLFL